MPPLAFDDIRVGEWLLITGYNQDDSIQQVGPFVAMQQRQIPVACPYLILAASYPYLVTWDGHRVGWADHRDTFFCRTTNKYVSAFLKYTGGSRKPPIDKPKRVEKAECECSTCQASRESLKGLIESPITPDLGKCPNCGTPLIPARKFTDLSKVFPVCVGCGFQGEAVLA